MRARLLLQEGLAEPRPAAQLMFRQALLIPLLVFAVVFVATLVYYRLGDDDSEAVTRSALAARGNGRLIVALEGNPSVRLYSVALDGSGGRFLTGDTEPTDGTVLVEAHPDWSRTTKRIVFTRYRIRGGRPAAPKIWAVDPDGSNLVQLTRGPTPDFLPAWSPDGRKIAFTREVRGPAEIFVMNADGSGVTQLTRDRATHDEHPAWSPDGGRIAYSSGTEDGQDLVVMNADGSQPTRLTDGPFVASDPAWSPDGEQIAFICDADLCLVGYEAGSRPVQLLGTAAKEFSPRWSPDGKWIAFARDPGLLMLLEVATRKLVRVPLQGNSFTLSWGPE
jgi:Tol biopolymer transport system component